MSFLKNASIQTKVLSLLIPVSLVGTFAFVKLFGFSIDIDGPLRGLWAIGEAILGGRTNWVTFAIGAATLAIILLLKNNKRIPSILIAVVSATVIVGLLDLGSRVGVSVLGPLDLAPLVRDASDCFSVRIVLFRFENSMRGVGWMA